MNTMNVNGQNGVATSAMIKNAVVKAVKMINNVENAKRGYVLIDEGLRLSFDGARFIRGAKDNFIFNGKIAKKCSNGRYDQVMVEIHYKNLDNEEGLCLNDMVNGVLGAILADIDNWIINYYKSESSSKWEYGLELYQNFRNDYFGSRLVVDNSENLDSPDTLNNDIEPIVEFFSNDDYKTLNDIENEFFGYHFDIDNELRDNLLFKRNGTFIDIYDKNMDTINNSVYIRLTDIKNIRDFENALNDLISTLNNDIEPIWVDGEWAWEDNGARPTPPTDPKMREWLESMGCIFDNDKNDSPDTLENVNRIVNVIKDYYINYIPSYLDQFGDCVITVYWDMFSENDMKILIENEKVALAVRDMLLSDNIILDKSGFLVGDIGVFLTVDYNKIPA